MQVAGLGGLEADVDAVGAGTRALDGGGDGFRLDAQVLDGVQIAAPLVEGLAGSVRANVMANGALCPETAASRQVWNVRAPLK